MKKLHDRDQKRIIGDFLDKEKVIKALDLNL